jgi:hypothetical protein
MPDGTILADVPESIQEKELFDKLSRNGYYVTPEWVKTQIKTPKKSNIFKTVICPLVFLLVIQWIILGLLSFCFKSVAYVLTGK